MRRFAEHGFTPLRRSAENGFTPLRRSAENGFTLVELMVALLIFGMIAGAGVSLLNSSIRAQAASTTKLAELGNQRRMASLLASDLAQAIPRVTRDTAGAPVRAFSGTNGVGALPMLRYVRSGWTNPGGESRASIQRVEITLVAGRLERRAYPMADGATAGAPQVLADNVESVRLRYRDKGPWSDVWTATTFDALPRAVEMTIKRRGEPALMMAFLVGSAS
jgi:general secretion pathway protein J